MLSAGEMGYGKPGLQSLTMAMEKEVDRSKYGEGAEAIKRQANTCMLNLMACIQMLTAALLMRVPRSPLK